MGELTAGLGDIPREGGEREREKKASSSPSHKKKWFQEYTRHNQFGSYYKLNRHDQVILLGLRTGHNRLTTNLPPSPLHKKQCR